MSEFATGSLLDRCLSDLNTVKDFNNLNKVINFYHFNDVVKTIGVFVLL